jgi:hypothetical protein
MCVNVPLKLHYSLMLTGFPESRVQCSSKHTALPLRAGRYLCIPFADRSSTAYYLWSLLPTGNSCPAAHSQSSTVPGSAQDSRYIDWNSHGASTVFYKTNSAGRADEVDQCASLFSNVKPEGWMPDHVGSTKPTSADQHLRERRRRTIAKVEISIRSHFGQEFSVEAFGSTQYGVDGRNSDLDLVVIVGIFLMFHL